MYADTIFNFRRIRFDDGDNLDRAVFTDQAGLQINRYYVYLDVFYIWPGGFYKADLRRFIYDAVICEGRGIHLMYFCSGVYNRHLFKEGQDLPVGLQREQVCHSGGYQAGFCPGLVYGRPYF